MSTIEQTRAAIAQIIGHEALRANELAGRLVVTTSVSLSAEQTPQVGRRSIAQLINDDAFSEYLAQLEQQKQLALDAIGDVADCAVVKHDTRNAWQMILRDASSPAELGKWRLQSFDAKGFSGHMVFANKQEAIDRAAISGYVVRDDDALERMFDTPAFQRGLFVSSILTQVNMGVIDFEQGNAQLERYDMAQSALHSIVGMGAQAFMAGDNRTMFLLADRISDGNESAVFLHEVTHRWGKSAMDSERWSHLVNQVKDWSNSPMGGVERRIHDRAILRLAQAKVSSRVQDEEFFAYAVEEAVALGVRPNAQALRGSASLWLDEVVQVLRQSILKSVQGQDLAGFPQDVQQLVDLAYAMAQLDSPERINEIRQRLSADEQVALSTVLARQGLSFTPEATDQEPVESPLSILVKSAPGKLNAAPAAQWLAWIDANGARLLGSTGQADAVKSSGLQALLQAAGQHPIATDALIAFAKTGLDFKTTRFDEGVASHEVRLDPAARGLLPGDDLVLARVHTKEDVEQGQRALVVKDVNVTGRGPFGPYRLDAEFLRFEDELRTCYAQDLVDMDWAVTGTDDARIRLASRLAKAISMTDLAAHFGVSEKLKAFRNPDHVVDAYQSCVAQAALIRTSLWSSINEIPALTVDPVLDAQVRGALGWLQDKPATPVSLDAGVLQKLMSGRPQPSRAVQQVFGDQPRAWYFSRLERALACAPKRLEAAPAVQWRQWIVANAPRLGVKDEDLQWSGLEQWLAMCGRTRLVQADLVAFVQANGVQVKDVVRTEAAYEAYKPDGGENYREILLTMPPVVSVLGWQTKPYRDDAWQVLDADGEPVGNFPANDPQDAIEQAKVYRQSAPEQRVGRDFHSLHWVGTPNVLAHLRVDERMDALGKRVLMVHEIQSDWAKELAKNTTDIAAPFVTSPQDWVALAVKRVIALAVEEGFDRVAFVTGEQVLNRFEIEDADTNIQVFYDQIVPSVVRDVLKKLGAGSIPLTQGVVSMDDGAGQQKWTVMFEDGGVHNSSWTSRSIAASIAQPTRGDTVVPAGVTGTRQPGFEITDALREAVGAGVALFSQSQRLLLTEKGEPLTVYRGEHSGDGQWLKSRFDSLSFGSARAACTYAQHPNHLDDVKSGDLAPRVMAAHLVMSRPFVNQPEDSFIDMTVLMNTLGTPQAMDIALRFEADIMNTQAWLDEGEGFESLQQLLQAHPEKLALFYVDAYRLFDDSEVVAFLKNAGYDGAIHAGNGETALEPEYRVFSPEQVMPVWSSDAVASTPLNVMARVDTFLDYWERHEDGPQAPYDDVVAFATALLNQVGKSKGIIAEFSPWQPFGMTTGIELTDLFAVTPGTGAGTEFMNQLGEVLDKLRLGLFLRPDGERSRNFYTRLGFEDAHLQYGFMVRYPKFDPDDDDEDYGQRRPQQLEQAEVMASFAGVKAQDGLIAPLASAIALLRQGVDANQVRQQTGWFNGLDGRWRVEISDHLALPRKLTALGLDGAPDGFVHNAVLEDVLYHQPLFDAYPQLRQMPVVLEVGRSGGEYSGYAEFEQIVLGVMPDNEGRMHLDLSVLMHEVQHAVGRIEGFATGSVPGAKAWLNPRLRPLLIERANKMTQAMSPPPYEQYWGEERTQEGEDQYAKFLQEWHSSEYQAKLALANQYGSSACLYQLMAGEVESRNVQARLAFDHWQRQQKHPHLTMDTPESEVVVLFDPVSPDGASDRVAFDFSLPPAGKGNVIRSFKVGPCTLALDVRESGAIHLASLRTPIKSRGQGHAKAAMTELLAQADAAGVDMVLCASALDSKTNQRRLETFYAAFGFEPTGEKVNALGDPVMARQVPLRWVCDKQGEPRTLYHGTSVAFSEFKPNERGIFLAGDMASACSFSKVRKDGAPRVLSAQIQSRRVWEIIRYSDDTPCSMMLDQTPANLKKLGFDAIHVPDDNVWIVFNPEQIHIVDPDVDTCALNESAKQDDAHG